jgi:ribosomal small subunit protein bTHX
MGKGDKRTKRGKVFAGSVGKYRLNPKKTKKLKAKRRTEEKKS